MSWGTELWDQYDNISLHTQKGIDFLEKYGHFIRDRCTIELEYAGKLRRLVKNYQPKKKDEEDYQYSPCRAFKHVMTEVNDLAGQHEVIAENLQANVIRELNILVKDIKEERKKHLQDGARMVQNLNTQILSLDRAKKNYEKAFKEAERALENFQRADADYNLSRAEVEKQRMNMAIKSQQCEETKNEYANQLQKTNELQNQHYHILMPDVFRQLQELDEKRIKNIKSFMIQSVDIEKNVFPIIIKCLDGIVNAAEQINEKEDTQLVIERYKSGFQPPEDIPFEDLSAIKSGEMPPPINPVPITTLRPEAMTVKGTMSSGKLKKRVGLFGIFSSTKNNFSANADNKEDYSDLPPNQRKKKLQQRVEEITAKIQQETAARDGLMKMKGVYEQNPALGDPMSIEGQLNESGHKLDKLRQELQKYQMYLEEANKPAVSPSAPSRRSKSHYNGAHLQQNHSSSNSPESGLGTSHTSLPDSDNEHGDNDPAPGDYCDGDLLPALGVCRALYPFEATSEGSIPMHDGEELFIIELDQGDGWTRVRRQKDGEEGFVPTSYIECNLYKYNSC
ncbi:formin-binding protein 1-like isoform X4 [Schistocerca americana]|uniref:formin-binding protein 1-like isoform X4 n=1 Tax=Schistocerca americana TaxID=7009 RepID=UPI001F4FB52E|nr:formin-binding protein 1-like isoform X4 [Schistocerca americana]XP_047102087.1 formin-binding protein 1-like isoform X4 [Schistocerca piceifrons]XP_049783415.1 formin-binding protein 1-like isoform X4 [Schistocerca cancellata]XP_049806364.1 formin-binding protein 1-like isoform X4 [Schistocerca nitens]XP_049844459.1 formin-binding protein 1-like isoform X9 [Schistocerca gregaria]XP_049953023.1 formin-binding protein 1-like isoform X4 [Schistocerca serialis cubense]